MEQGFHWGLGIKGAASPPYLHCHVRHDGALVALQGLQGDLGDLSLRLAQEHLASGCQHLLVLPLDLHLRPAGPIQPRTPPFNTDGTRPL